MASETIVERYSFRPEDLAPATRKPGISAFMRIKNGGDFLEPTIRSHINHFDEIVAVYNQCTDATPDILARLAREYGDKLRVFHYLPKVFPPGSEGHAREPAESPRSFVNYYNFALAQTRYAVATKLDDDHLAIEDRLAELVARVRASQFDLKELLCFSGFNVAASSSGKFGVLANSPFAGTGDHWFFTVSPTTHFIHDDRFERLSHPGLNRRFGDFTYWHLKHLKGGYGFGVYDIEQGGNARYERKLNEFLADRRTISLDELRQRVPPLVSLVAKLPLPERVQFRVDRFARMLSKPPDKAALDRIQALGALAVERPKP